MPTITHDDHIRMRSVAPNKIEIESDGFNKNETDLKGNLVDVVTEGAHILDRFIHVLDVLGYKETAHRKDGEKHIIQLTVKGQVDLNLEAHQAVDKVMREINQER